MQPTIGRIVIYKLAQVDVDQIHRRRTTGNSIAERIRNCAVGAIPPGPLWQGPNGGWPIGAQAHIGNPHHAGQEVPMTIVRVWEHEFGHDVHGVNGQALLDGNDVLWLTSVQEGEREGQWHWPVKV